MAGGSVAGTRIVSIVGRKDAGKTTLLVALAGEFARRGIRVMTLKHGHHAAAPDAPGTDSWRHFTEGKAERTLLAGPGGRLLLEKADDVYDPRALARQYLAGADLVLVEGYKRSDLPKVEVHRKAVKAAPLYPAGTPETAQWIAVVTDDHAFAAEGVRVLRFTDTMWLQLLANLAWERAERLDP